jgi:Flp pilus assembly protein TadD
MKRVVVLLALGALILGGCNPLKKMSKNAHLVSYSVNPQTLQMVGGNVQMSLTGTYPAEYFHKKVKVQVSPVLKAGSGETSFGNYMVQGESISENNKVIPFGGGSFTYSSSVPFTDAMKVSQLEVRPVGYYKKKSLAFAPVKVADGVISTALLVNKTGKAVYASDKYVRVTSDALETDIKYLINKADVRKSEASKGEIKEFTESLKAAKADDRVEIAGARLSAYASPDGPETLNEKLAGNRQSSALKFFTKELQTAQVEDVVKSDFLQVVSTPEDWEGFKEMMEASDIKDKQLILRVLSMYSDPVVREREIKNIAAAYEEVKDKILPALRRSKMIVEMNYIGRSDEEIVAQFSQDPSKLSVEELLVAGKVAATPERKAEVYRTAARLFPSESRIQNNLGVALLELGRTAEAKTALTAGQRLENTDLVKNNLGVVALREGAIAQAEELFASVSSLAEARSNLGAVKIIKGQYSEALSYLNADQDVNGALAKLLSNQTDAALSTLNATKSDDAMVYYMKALVGARTQNTSLLYQNLTTAVSKNPALKAVAAADAEFARYFEDATFSSIVR